MISKAELSKLPKGDYRIESVKTKEGKRFKRVVPAQSRQLPKRPPIELIPQFLEEYKLIKEKRSALSRTERDKVEAYVAQMIVNANQQPPINGTNTQSPEDRAGAPGEGENRTGVEAETGGA